MTNSERADRLLQEARRVAREMRNALADGAWNLATRRPQEALDLAIKAVLNQMGVEYPKTHDAAPILGRAAHTRSVRVDAGELDPLMVLSRELAGIRGPAFYQETLVTEAQARDWVHGVEQRLQFLEDLLSRLR